MSANEQPCCIRHCGEIRGDVDGVGGEQQRYHHMQHPSGIMPADIARYAVPRDAADAGGNLLDRRHQRKAQQHGPADAVAELCAGLAVGAHPRGVVVGGAGGQAGAERFEEGADAEGLVPLARRLVAAMLVMDVLGFRVVRHASDPAAATTIASASRFRTLKGKKISRKTRLTLTLRQRAITRSSTTEELPMTPTRRTFTALLAASAVALPRISFAQGPARAGTIKTKDGVELFVKDTGGNGRAIVLTHAWPLNADIWDYQAAALSKAGYRVISYDRRGFGRSGKPETGYSFDTFADDLAAVIEQTGVRDATIAGYSMGGGEVVRYLTRHNNRHVVKAGLVGGAAYYLLKTENNPLGADGSVFDGMKQGVQGDRKAFLTGLLTNVFFDARRPSTVPVTQDVIDSAVAMAIQASVPATIGCIDAFSTTDFRPELASVKVPTLVLHGTADIPVSFDQAKATAGGIAGSKLIAYQDASHGIVVTERDRVTRDLQAFLAG